MLGFSSLGYYTAWFRNHPRLVRAGLPDPDAAASAAPGEYPFPSPSHRKVDGSRRGRR